MVLKSRFFFGLDFENLEVKQPRHRENTYFGRQNQDLEALVAPDRFASVPPTPGGRAGTFVARTNRLPRREHDFSLKKHDFSLQNWYGTVFVQRMYSTVEGRTGADHPNSKIFVIFQPQTTEYDPATPPPVPQ